MSPVPPQMPELLTSPHTTSESNANLSLAPTTNSNETIIAPLSPPEAISTPNTTKESLSTTEASTATSSTTTTSSTQASATTASSNQASSTTASATTVISTPANATSSQVPLRSSSRIALTSYPAASLNGMADAALLPKPGFTIEPIGIIHTPFAEKFAVPRQPGLAPCESTIELFPPYSNPQAVQGLEGFSHIHVIFIFDKAEVDKFRPMVRPPRLGGNTKMGIFATRSPFRPSRLGLSVLKLKGIEIVKGHTRLKVEGADMVDGTPILDLKPYIPFVDAIPDATSGFAAAPPPRKEVHYNTAALAEITKQGLDKESLDAILSQDPRPAYKGAKADDDRIYGATIASCHIQFKVTATSIEVIACTPLSAHSPMSTNY